MKTSELLKEDYNPYYQTYILALGEVNLKEELIEGLAKFEKFAAEIPEEKLNYAYAEGKWTVAEALVHIIDTERVFQYRALCFSRNDKASFPGFEQDDYILNANAGNRSKKSLLEEFTAVRKSSIALFNSFSETDLQKRGVASGSSMSVGAVGFILSGHLNHHKRILEERYL
ncbi:DinB family protein [Cellulophaga sp. L1A9]|uniref:DinB family protein n=1 Tax=Cellulophaga sp. L1A9 TaxID=2686362 RepID=UPI00131B65AA|nr:DinB family protein [Cellulophaga sp. L1A9]